MSSKHKNEYGTFHLKKNFWLNQKRFLVYGILLVVFVSGLGLAINKKFINKKVELAQVAQINSEIPGWWYQQYFGSSVCDRDICKPGADPDKDKLTNAQEFYYHSDPLKLDTNADGLSDGQDVAQGFDPSQPGKTTFDEIKSEDNILGESLVFDTDAVKVFAEVTDLSKAKLPQVNTSELKVTNHNSKDTVAAYGRATQQIISQYFPTSITDLMTEAIKSQDSDRLDDLKLRSTKVLIALKSLEVPSNALALHKDYIGIFQLLPAVVSMPAPADLQSQTSLVGNTWFDQTQSFMSLMQQSSIEEKRLQAKYP